MVRMGHGCAGQRGRWFFLLLCVVGFVPVGALPADGNALKMSPGLRLSSLAAHPDSDMIELSDGKHVRLGDLRRVEQAARKLRSASAKAVPPAGLQFRSGSGGMQIKDAAGIVSALKRPDSETIVLPSGRRVTAGQLRFVKPYVEMRLGRSLDGLSKRPNLSGPALKVTDKSDWNAILQKPEQTVLESPSGKRITVGELKQAIRDGKLPLNRSSAGKR